MKTAIESSIFGRGTGMGMYPIVTACKRRGEKIANAKTKHKIMLTRDINGLTILGLGTSVKSAPYIPAPRETAPKAKISRTDSINNATVMSSEGHMTRIPTTPHTNATTHEKMTIKAYLHLTKLRAVIARAEVDMHGFRRLEKYM